MCGLKVCEEVGRGVRLSGESVKYADSLECTEVNIRPGKLGRCS